MKKPILFKWHHFEDELILLSVRWYLRYSLSYRDLEETMQERRTRTLPICSPIEASRHEHCGDWRWWPCRSSERTCSIFRILAGYESMHMVRKSQKRGSGRYRRPKAVHRPALQYRCLI